MYHEDFSEKFQETKKWKILPEETYSLKKSLRSESKMMTEDSIINENLRDLDNICDECNDEDESVSQNLILTGFKICKSCRISKTIFPI